MYRHILVPTDGSTDSKRAAREAARLAEAHGARLTVLTVVQDVDTGALDGLGMDELERALGSAARREGESRLEETVAELGETSVPKETRVVAGVPHRAICNYVEATDVDDVVLGTAGRDSLAEYILGSTTERVSRLCDVPVTVV